MRISEFKPVVERKEKSVFVLIGDGLHDKKALEGLVKKLTWAGELSCNVELLLPNRKHPQSVWKGNSVFRAINVLASKCRKFLVFYDLEHYRGMDEVVKVLRSRGCTVSSKRELGDNAYHLFCRFGGRDIEIFFSVLGRKDHCESLEDCIAELLRRKGISLKLAGKDRYRIKKEIRNSLRKLRIRNYKELILNSDENDVKQAFRNLYLVLKEIDKSFNEHRAP